MTRWTLPLISGLLWVSFTAGTAQGQSELATEVAGLAEVDEELVFGPLIVPEGIEERDGIGYPHSPFDWGVMAVGPMDSEACQYACGTLNGKVILPFEMQVAARPVQRHLVRMGYRSEALWVETGKGVQARPLPFDPNDRPLKLKRTVFQPMCLCTGAIIGD